MNTDKANANGGHVPVSGILDLRNIWKYFVANAAEFSEIEDPHSLLRLFRLVRGKTSKAGAGISIEEAASRMGVEQQFLCENELRIPKGASAIYEEDGRLYINPQCGFLQDPGSFQRWKAAGNSLRMQKIKEALCEMSPCDLIERGLAVLFLFALEEEMQNGDRALTKKKDMLIGRISSMDGIAARYSLLHEIVFLVNLSPKEAHITESGYATRFIDEHAILSFLGKIGYRKKEAKNVLLETVRGEYGIGRCRHLGGFVHYFKEEDMEFDPGIMALLINNVWRPAE